MIPLTVNALKGKQQPTADNQASSSLDSDGR